ncbi:hypothetical protein O181_046300 [Austropuccinia psidii MF-1]|uniref:Uncharacterized protein n=1 Tax=Austropuccinia psidii MF-1 TaxID=1389203 RepID=A0A9Q3DT28_9BASI|nr:hypothetical protein [Austropuccinia psidii MF-1]
MKNSLFLTFLLSPLFLSPEVSGRRRNKRQIVQASGSQSGDTPDSIGYGQSAQNNYGTTTSKTGSDLGAYSTAGNLTNMPGTSYSGDLSGTNDDSASSYSDGMNNGGDWHSMLEGILNCPLDSLPGLQPLASQVQGFVSQSSTKTTSSSSYNQASIMSTGSAFDGKGTCDTKGYVTLSATSLTTLSTFYSRLDSFQSSCQKYGLQKTSELVKQTQTSVSKTMLTVVQLTALKEVTTCQLAPAQCEPGKNIQSYIQSFSQQMQVIQQTLTSESKTQSSTQGNQTESCSPLDPAYSNADSSQSFVNPSSSGSKIPVGVGSSSPIQGNFAHTQDNAFQYQKRSLSKSDSGYGNDSGSGYGSGSSQVNGNGSTQAYENGDSNRQYNTNDSSQNYGNVNSNQSSGSSSGTGYASGSGQANGIASSQGYGNGDSNQQYNTNDSSQSYGNEKSTQGYGTGSGTGYASASSQANGIASNQGYGNGNSDQQYNADNSAQDYGNGNGPSNQGSGYGSGSSQNYGTSSTNIKASHTSTTSSTKKASEQSEVTITSQKGQKAISAPCSFTLSQSSYTIITQTFEKCQETFIAVEQVCLGLTSSNPSKGSQGLHIGGGNTYISNINIVKVIQTNNKNIESFLTTVNGYPSSSPNGSGYPSSGGKSPSTDYPSGGPQNASSDYPSAGSQSSSSPYPPSGPHSSSSSYPSDSDYMSSTPNSSSSSYPSDYPTSGSESSTSAPKSSDSPSSGSGYPSSTPNSSQYPSSSPQDTQYPASTAKDSDSSGSQSSGSGYPSSSTVSSNSASYPDGSATSQKCVCTTDKSTHLRIRSLEARLDAVHRVMQKRGLSEL